MPRSFPPVVGKSPRVLILGSMPGEASLKLRQYYGHPHNQFWRLLGEVLGEDLRGKSYRGRLAVLKRRKIALWDTLAFCRREGSLDSDIRDEKTNKIIPLLRRHRIKAVFFNGQKARSVFLRHHRGNAETVELIALPSSSPANASLSFKKKLRLWRRIARRLAAHPTRASASSP